MKPLSPPLTNHLAQEVTTLATCWKLTRRDGTVLGFTEHDRNLLIDSITYLASSGFTPSAIASNTNLAADSLALEGVLDADLITERDILAGLYDFAEIEIFMVNFADTSQGKLTLRRGTLGEISLQQQQFTAEIFGLTEQMAQVVGDLYSPSCRAKLGDDKCKVNLADFTVTGTLTGVTSSAVVSDDALMQAAGWFNFGRFTFTSGENNGLTREVKNFTGGQLTFALAFPYPIVIGDTYTLSAGCDKTSGTCKAKFTNLINFRGEPDVPGTDAMLKVGG